MDIRYGHLYLAELSPQQTRPVLVMQTDLLNETQYPSTWVLLCTTRTTQFLGENIIRVLLPKELTGADRDCAIMIEQSHAIDNRRLTKKLGKLPQPLLNEVREKLKKLGELETSDMRSGI